MNNLLAGHRKWLLVLIPAGILAAFLLAGKKQDETPPSGSGIPAAGAPRPSLTVRTVHPRQEEWPQILSIDGNVMAWQEAVIGAEIGQYRIAEVAVQVGDRVHKGQVLARIDNAAIASELAEARAAVAELEAAAGEAKGNAERSQALRAQGFYSTQMDARFATAERAAEARLTAARARLESAELRMKKTSVTAPDDGVISARTATVGSLTQQGQELFRLIRGGRLEWQAEIPAASLARVKPGAAARLIGPDGNPVTGRVRNIAPSVNPGTRNGIVYVDLPPTSVFRAGMFARGEIETGRAPALTLPQSALVLREGFSYVFGIAAGGTGDQVRVMQIRVKPGRRSGDRIEIVDGLQPDVRVVESGAGFLADGDAVTITTEAVATAVAGSPAP